MNGMALTAGATLVAFLQSVATAQVSNGGFENGFEGWTVANTPNGVGAPGVLSLFDIDGPGPQSLSQAARFSVGRSTQTFGDYEGVVLSQNIQLVGGISYLFSFDWATVNDEIYPNLQSGLFNVYLNGQYITQGDGNVILENSSNFGRVETLHAVAATGSYLLEIEISRPFATDGTGLLRQYIDNVSVAAVPAPGLSVVVLAGACWVGGRRRR